MTNHNDDWLLYNASEYTVNGKTYRNLEAEVLYNHRLSEQNAEDIDALEGRMHTAEQDIDSLENRMDAAEQNISEHENRLDALGDTIYYFTTFSGGHPTYQEVIDKLDNGYLPAIKISGAVFLYHRHTNDYIDFVNVAWDSDGSPAHIIGRRLNKTSPGALQNISQTVPNDEWIETLANAEIDDRIVTTLSSSSTDSEIPSAKATYNISRLVKITAAAPTTYEDVLNIINEGKIPFFISSNVVYIYTHTAASSGVNYHYFSSEYYTTLRRAYVRQDTNAWTISGTATAQITSNKKSSPQTSATYYPDFSYINNYVSPYFVDRSMQGTWNRTFAQIKTEIDKNIRPVILRAYVDSSLYEIYILKEYDSESSRITFYKVADKTEKQLWINDDGTTGSAEHSLMSIMQVNLSYNGSLNLVADKTYTQIVDAISNGTYVYCINTSNAKFYYLTEALTMMNYVAFTTSNVSGSGFIETIRINSNNVLSSFSKTIQ